MLSDPLCDAWVASDVLACTASILNLTAISVDRFIAVTQPIKYAKHKNSKRVFIMLAITWVISVAIAAPIALGVNYSDDRNVGDCRFFNSDFIIYSSMGSFYIPSIIMIFLYWKIYKVIRLRALKAKKAKCMRDVDKRALQSVIENPAVAAGVALNDTGGVYGASEATVTTGLAKMDNGRVTYNTTTSSKATTSRFLSTHGGDDGSITNVNSNSDDNSNEDDDDDSPSGSGSGSANNNTNNPKCMGVAKVVVQVNPRLLRSVEVAELITNPVAEELDRLESEEQRTMLQFGKNGGCASALDCGGSGSASTSGGAAPTCANEAETPFTSLVCKGDTSDTAEVTQGMLSPKKKTKREHKKAVTKFNFHMRTSRKRKEKSSSKREKKATKTLAIVL
ncbi:muscarinic acetylcholine receptor M3, partial [Biomphalaria pfeifferi]